MKMRSDLNFYRSSPTVTCGLERWQPDHVLVMLFDVTALSRIIGEFVDSRVIEVADVLVLG